MHAESFAERFPTSKLRSPGKRVNIVAHHECMKLCQIAIRRPVRILHAFQVLPLDQAFDPLLDHVDIGHEPHGQLLDDFSDELLVGKLLALPESLELASHSISANKAEGNAILHNPDNSGFDTAAAGFIVLLLRLLAFILILDFVAACHDSDFNLRELTVEAFIEEEFIAKFDVFAHRLFDQNSSLSGDSKGLEIAC